MIEEGGGGIAETRFCGSYGESLLPADRVEVSEW
jgi:hypothetical protein